MKNTASVLVLLIQVLATLAAFAAEPPIDKPDLDVICISRTPRYPSLHGKVGYVDLTSPFLQAEAESITKFFPEQGETVTFTAKFTNKGTPIEGEIAYCWRIDGELVKRGSVEAPKFIEKPRYEPWTTVPLEWKWQNGPHTVTFELDPDATLSEFSRANNSKTDRTDSLGFLFAVTRDAYDDWNAEKNMLGTYSFEDWMNWHFDEMNREFEQAVYHSTPDGCRERVHVETFVVVDKPEDMKDVDHFGYSGGWTFRHTERPLGKRADTPDAGLIHELGHQIGLIDQYSIGFPLYANRLTDMYGQPAMRGYVFFQSETNMYNPSAMRWSELTAAALNRQKGYPRGYFGIYLFDHAEHYSIRVLDKTGKPLPNASVTFYRAIAGQLIKQQEGRTNEDGLMPLENDNTPRYTIPRSPFEVHPTPFGKISILGGDSVVCFQVRANDQEDVVMTEAAWFLVCYWRTGTPDVTVDIATTIGAANGPPPPHNVRAEWTDDGHVRLVWDAPPGGDTPVTYNVYEAHLPDAWAGRMTDPELVAEKLASPEYLVGSVYPSMQFYVTPVDGNGLEGGASRRIWVTAPPAPNADVGIVYDRARDRLVLTGAWECVNSYSTTSGFWPISYWIQTPRGATTDANGNLLAAVDGAHRAVRMLDLSAPTPAPELMVYGDPQKGGVTFNKPRDVAVDGMGNVVAADTGNGRVVVLSAAGDLVTILGGEGPDNDKLVEPVSVAVLPDGRIVIGDAQLGKLVSCSIKGPDKLEWSATTGDRRWNAVDLLVISGGHLLVVDQASGTVSALRAPAYAAPEPLVGDLKRPTSVTVAKDGTLIVYDSGRPGMQAFVESPGALTKGSTTYLESLPRDKLAAFSVLPPEMQAACTPPIVRDAWAIVGPFDNAGMKGFDVEYGPEKEPRLDLRRTYNGIGGKVAWQKLPVRGCPDGTFIDLNACFTPNDAVCAYAAATVLCDAERTVRILTGSDDTITMWVNGEKVLSKNELRAASPGQDTTDVTLRKGENSILVKVCDEGGGWGFYFRIADPGTGKPPAGIRFKTAL